MSENARVPATVQQMFEQWYTARVAQKRRAHRDPGLVRVAFDRFRDMDLEISVQAGEIPLGVRR